MTGTRQEVRLNGEVIGWFTPDWRYVRKAGARPYGFRARAKKWLMNAALLAYRG